MIKEPHHHRKVKNHLAANERSKGVVYEKHLKRKGPKYAWQGAINR
jgi:hypothetical protein